VAFFIPSARWPRTLGIFLWSIHPALTMVVHHSTMHSQKLSSENAYWLVSLTKIEEAKRSVTSNYSELLYPLIHVRASPWLWKVHVKAKQNGCPQQLTFFKPRRKESIDYASLGRSLLIQISRHSGR